MLTAGTLESHIVTFLIYKINKHTLFSEEASPQQPTQIGRAHV